MRERFDEAAILSLTPALKHLGQYPDAHQGTNQQQLVLPNLPRVTQITGSTLLCTLVLLRLPETSW
jgi:hypothetical protein